MISGQSQRAKKIMKHYDPLLQPDSAEWLALDEDQRIELVRVFHNETGIELPNETVHATVHAIVENQIALEVSPVAATIDKLNRQGLDRHDALHAVGAVLMDDLNDLMKHKDGMFDHGKYAKRLNKLTAKRWRKGKW